MLKIEKAYRAMRARRMMKNAAKQLKNIARNQQILEKQVIAIGYVLQLHADGSIVFKNGSSVKNTKTSVQEERERYFLM